MGRFSREHYRRVSPPPDTLQDIADRLMRREAGEQALRDRENFYPLVTPENAQDAIDYQGVREQFHLKGLSSSSAARSRFMAEATRLKKLERKR